MFSSLRAYVESIFRRDPAARSTLEVLTTYPGVHALAFHRVTHWLWTRRLMWLARVLSHISRFLTGIEIHPGARIGRRLFIDHGMGVVIGETAEIGDDCTLYQGVTLGGTTWRKEKRHPTVGNNVVIGAGAKVLGPLTIGNNSRVGSNSVVTKDVPADVTVVGIPARVMGTSAKPRIGNRGRFDAYGQPAKGSDPIAHTINCLVSHIQVLDEQLRTITQELERKGINISIHLPGLDVSVLENGDSEAPEADSSGRSK